MYIMKERMLLTHNTSTKQITVSSWRTLIISMAFALMIMNGMCQAEQQETASAFAIGGMPVAAIDTEGLCGPISLWTASMRLGNAVDLERIIELTFDDARTVSMLSLKEAAEELGLNAIGMKVDWEYLSRLQTPAILFVKGNHFVCADPREGKDKSSVRLYDWPNKTTFVKAEDLEQIWNGEMLEIIPPVIEEVAAGEPRIQFESLLEDFGSVENTERVDLNFFFKNIGDATLEIKKVEKSCGCTSVETSSEHLAPGETAVVSADFELRGRKNLQFHHINVLTNDSGNEKVTLFCRGFAEYSVVLSESTLDFRSVVSGQSATHELTLTDRSTEFIEIESGEMKIFGRKYDEKRGDSALASFTTEVGWEPLTTKSDIAKGRSRFPLHKIVTSVFVSDKVEPGEYVGEMTITTTSLRNSQFSIPIEIEVLDDIKCTPKIILFTSGKPGKRLKRTVSLRSRTGKTMNYLSSSATVSGYEQPNDGPNICPMIKILKNGGSEISAELEIKVPSTAKTGDVFRGEVVLELENRKLWWPWLCHIE